MSKNLTRKGLALGAVVALGSTLFAGAPASAGIVGSNVTLSLLSGTSNNFLLGSTAKLTSNYATALNIVGGQHRFLIEDATGQVKADADKDAGTAVPATLTYTSGKAVVTAEDDYTTADELFLSLPNTVTATTTATVTAWYDADADSVIDDNEHQSSPQVIKFLAVADISATTTLDAPVLGAGSLTAKVATVPSLNGDQIGANGVIASFTRQGSTDTEDGTSTWSNTTGLWTATVSLTQTAANTPWAGLADTADTATAGIYSAKAKIGTTAVGSAVSQTVVAATAAEASATLAENANVAITSGNASAAVAGKVRPLTASTAVATLSVVDSATAAEAEAVTAGRPVVLSVTETSSGVVTVNGTTVTTSGTVNAVTDAKGQVVITVTNTALFAATEEVVITAVAEGVAATSTVVTLTATAVAYSIVDTADLTVEQTSERSIATGGSVNYNLAIVDQYAQYLSGDYRVLVNTTGRTVNSAYYTLSGGKVSFAVADAKIGASASIEVDVDVQKLVSGSYTDTHGLTFTANLGEWVNKVINVADKTNAGAISLTTADLSEAVATEVTTAGDSRFDFAALFADEAAANVTLEGTVSDSITGATRPGAVVTVSGASNLLFKVGSKTAFGSLTFHAGAAGAYSVDVYSNKIATDSVVTISADGGSKTAKVSFTALTATSITVSAPAKVASGSVSEFSVVVVDKHGNKTATDGGSELIISNEGVGYLTTEGTIDPAVSTRTRLITGTADRGLATVTVSFDADGDGDLSDTGNLTVSKSVLVGITAGARGDVKAVSSLVKGAAGLTVKIVRGAKVATAIATSDSYRISLKGIKAGKRSVKVYVNDVLVKSGTVTVK